MEDKMFFDGMFHTGKPSPVKVVERDYACEYSLAPYLAQATIGQEVAVLSATLTFGIDPEDCEPLDIEWEPRFASPNLSLSWDTCLVILPGVGLWVCQPVFDSVKEAYEQAQRLQYVLNSFLQEEETPVHIGLFPMSDAPPNLAGIDPKYYYGPEVYGAVAESLELRSRPFDSGRADAMIRELMELIYYSDVKAPDYHFPISTVPRWLTRYADFGVAA